MVEACTHLLQVRLSGNNERTRGELAERPIENVDSFAVLDSLRVVHIHLLHNRRLLLHLLPELLLLLVLLQLGLDLALNLLQLLPDGEVVVELGFDAAALGELCE